VTCAKFSLILLIALGSCNEPAAYQKTQAVADSTANATVKLTGLDGWPISLDQYKGRTIFLNFWATWCKPCLREMPHIQSAQEILRKNGIVFLLASNETLEQIKEFKQLHTPGLNFVRLTNMEELGITGLPTTYIYNPQGEKVFAETGYRKWDDSTNIEMILKMNNQK
jgi:thiol-disulfide isomerase/thioredoxin